MNTLEIKTNNAEETRRLGVRLGSALRAGDVICLQGDLGAGKTTFVQGIADGWGSLDAVSSPTFILVNMYRRADGGRLHHMDAYRLDSLPEAEALDLDSMLADGALLVEWARRIEPLLPTEHVWIEFEHLGDEERLLKAHAVGARHSDLLALLKGGA